MGCKGSRVQISALRPVFLTHHRKPLYPLLYPLYETAVNAPRMLTFHIPEDQPEFLKAAARVSLSHGHLDYSLRMCIKTFAEVEIGVALRATQYTGARQLRARVRKFAKKRLGDGPIFVRFQDLLARCGEATEQRNRLIHEICALDENGVPLLGYLSW